MSRKHRAQTREVLPDPRFQDVVVTKFVRFNERWQESCSRNNFLWRFGPDGKKTGEEPLKLFKKALSNVKPAVEVKSRRIGGATCKYR